MLDNFSDLTFAQQLLKKKRRHPSRSHVTQKETVSYSRDKSPAVQALCKTLAELEHAEECVVTSFGLGAILTLCVANLKSGDHIIISEDCFRSQKRQFIQKADSLGFVVSFVKNDVDAWKEAVNPNTRMAFLSLQSSDDVLQKNAQLINTIAQILRENASQPVQLVVDNTDQTCFTIKPLEHGADFVLYTSTKGLESNASVVAGAICGKSDNMKPVSASMRETHVCVSPFNAWAILRGLGAEGSAVLDRIFGACSKDGSDKVVSLQERLLLKSHECPAL